MAATEALAVATTTQSWRDGMSSDNVKGLVLALSSSVFIGASFIVKKKGLKKAGASGVRAGMFDLFRFLNSFSVLIAPIKFLDWFQSS